MSYFRFFRCTECGSEYALDEVRYLCPSCSRDYRPGMPLRGVLEAVFDYVRIAKHLYKSSKDIGTLREVFSAIDTKFYPPLPVGNTPLFRIERLGRKVGLSELYIKNDGVNPSGSYKDRASQLVVAEAIRLGIEEIV